MSYADGLLSSGERILYRTQAAPVHLRLGSSIRDPRHRHRAWSGLARRQPRGLTARSPVAGPCRRSSSSSVGSAVFAWTAIRYIEPGVRAHQPPGDPGRGGAEPHSDRQLAREDQRRRADPVDLRPAVRVRRPGRPDSSRKRHRTDAHAPRPDRLQEDDARREARLRGRHGALGLDAGPAASGRAGRWGSGDGRGARPASAPAPWRQRVPRPSPLPAEPAPAPPPRADPMRSPGRSRTSPISATAAPSRPRSTRARRPTCSPGCKERHPPR